MIKKWPPKVTIFNKQYVFDFNSIDLLYFAKATKGEVENMTLEPITFPLSTACGTR
jgi:hypothetical protein